MSRTVFSLSISLSLLLAVLFTAGCSQPNRIDILKYKKEIFELRTAKDRYFKESPESPLIQEHQWSFKGLAYYAPEIRYKVTARFHRIDEPQTFQIATSSGHERTYATTGRLEFTLQGKPMSLMAYQSETAAGQPEGGNLFVPFSDLTNGSETYGGGRYLDLHYPENNSVVLDFNLAYNPYCAYNKNYSCPIPPQENHLDLAVSAGEKMFPMALH